MINVDELEYWMRIALEKNEDGTSYLNGDRQQEAWKMVNKIRGISDTIDVEFEIIQPKLLSNDPPLLPTSR